MIILKAWGIDDNYTDILTLSSSVFDWWTPAPKSIGNCAGLFLEIILAIEDDVVE